MNQKIINLQNLIKECDPLPLEYGPLEDDQSQSVVLPTNEDITVSCQDRRLYVWKNPPRDIIDYVKNTLGGSGPSGNWIYQKGGYQGWHTNSNVLGQRLYVSWAEENAKSGMKFFIDNQVVDSPDYQGWNIRLFTPPVWHSVYADCLRVSLGFIFKESIDTDIILPVKV
jgi:hypothetical protein